MYNNKTVDVVVKSALKSWTSLGLALQHGFVEGNALQKYNNLITDLTDLCASGADKLDIEDLLEAAAYHDFNFLDEEGSFRELARDIVKCLTDLNNGAGEETIAQYFPSVSGALERSKCGEDKTEEVDENTALSEMVDNMTMNQEQAVQEEKPVPRPEPIIDEDGFELVQRRRRK